MRILFDNYRFENPLSIIECYKLSEIFPALEKMESALSEGFYLAGFFSYEAGYAFEPLFHHPKKYPFPLVCFGIYERPLPLSLWERGMKKPTFVLKERGEGEKNQYLASLRKIKAYLAAGETYQVNYTFKLKFNFSGDPFELYSFLRKRQPTAYSAYIERDNFHILSLSPELFFRKEREKITVKPMKGTLGKGPSMPSKAEALGASIGNRHRLRRDAKNQAENLMIVDLLRNDLGRIAKIGSIKTVKLFEIEEHPTLYQMTSTIEAKVPENINLQRLFGNLFPSGSVTGAPKIRTMQIIQELEKEERGIYTGAIGYITPKKDMLFNVAIRTLLLTTYNLQLTTFKGELGIGSGITYDSDPESEFEECLLKASFLKVV